MKKLYWLTTVLTPNPRLDVATHETYGGDGINKMLRRFFVCVAGRSMTLWRRSYCPHQIRTSARPLPPTRLLVAHAGKNQRYDGEARAKNPSFQRPRQPT